MSNSDTSIEVKIGGDASEVKAAAADGGAAIEQMNLKIQAAFAALTQASDRQSKAFAEAAEKNKAAAESVGSAFKSLSDKMNAALKTMAFAELGRQIVGTMSAFENLEIRLRSVMGSAQKGDDAFAWIKRFAKDTPFEVDGVTKAFMLLKNMGLDPMDGTLKSISDQASKAGQGQEGLMRISLALGQAFTKAKLQGDDMNQLLEAGVPVWDMLARATGKTTQELRDLSEKGRLGRDAIKLLIDEMGRSSAGASGAMMDSLSGQWSNFTDNLKNALDELRTAGGLDDLKAALSAINDVMSQLAESGELKAWAQGTGQAMHAVGDSLASILSMIGETVKELTSLVSSGFGEIGTLLSTTFGTEKLTALDLFRNMLKVVEIGVAALKNGFEISGEVISSVIESLVVGLTRFASAASKALQLDFSGAKQAWDEGGAELERIHAEHLQNMIRLSEEAAAKIEQIALRKPASGRDAGGGRGFVNPEPVVPTRTVTPLHLEKGKESGDDGRMPEFEAALAARKDAMEKQAADEGRFRELSKQEEADYWQAILQRTDLTSKERAGVQSKYYAAMAVVRKEAFAAEVADLQAQKEEMGKNYEGRITIAQQVAQQVAAAYGVESKEAKRAYADIRKEMESLADQRKRIDDQIYRATLQRQQIELDAERQHELDMAELYGVSAEQKLEIERQFLDRRYAMDLADAERAIESANPERDPEAYQKLCDQKLEIEARYQAQLSQLRDKVTATKASPAANFIDGMSESVSSTFGQILSGAKTWSAGIRSVFQGVRDSFIKSVVTDPMQAQLAAWGKMLAQKLGFLAQDKALDATAMATKVSMKGTEAMAAISANAAEAGSGAAASQASIPYVGPALAAAAMATTFAAVMAMGGKVASAAGGFAIPKGVNPMTQLHEEEMVLPAHISKPLQEAISSGGLGGAGKSHTNLSITAMDTRSISQSLRQGGALDKALRGINRDFRKI